MAKGLDDLQIYQLAGRLEIYVHKVLLTFPRKAFRDVDQLDRSSSSVTNNIAESYGRFSYQDKINKMYIARGEAEETKGGIVKSYKKGYLKSVKVVNLLEEQYTVLLKRINKYISFLKTKKDKHDKPT